ncbi:MAG: transcription activator effector binding protein [Myxococcales bacterium]|nr:transcription activator effector binding protein [Myxococcales bacterium]
MKSGAPEDGVKLEPLRPRWLAAVRRTAAPRDVPRVFKPALDLVWAFLKKHEGLRTDGHNVFLYHHVMQPDGAMPIDFGVEVTRRFEPEGDVHCVETPAGEAAVLRHRGPYTGLPGAHAAVKAWFVKNGRRVGGNSLEIYGDWREKAEEMETTVLYLVG